MLCYETQMQKKVDARFFFQVCFGDLAQLKLLPSEHSPNPWFSRLQMLCGEAEKGGAWDGLQKLRSATVACPLATPGCFKNESTLWGFVSYHKWASFCKQTANKNPSFGHWLQMMDLWEAKEGVQYNGSHPTTSKVYTDLRGSEWLLPSKASFVDAIQMKLDFQDFGTSQKYGSSFCSRRCMLNFLDDLSVISS